MKTDAECKVCQDKRKVREVEQAKIKEWGNDRLRMEVTFSGVKDPECLLIKISDAVRMGLYPPN